jgi:allophanate hydrolase subunit 1
LIAPAPLVSDSQVRLLPNGDTALAVEFGDRIDRATSERVLALHDRVARAALPGVVELLPTFRSLMVHYDPARTTHAALAATLAPLAVGLEGVKPAARRWTIPVCYDPGFALDLEEVAARTGRTPAALWSRARTPPAVLAPGDKVRFAPIGMAEFERLAAQAAAGALELASEAA